MDSKYFSMFE